jgi:hypothetical protein
MAITWRESLKGFGPVVVFSDPYTVLEWRDAINALTDGRTTTEPLRLLLDGRHCNTPTAEFVVRALSVMETRNAHVAGARFAILVGSDASYAMGRLAEAAVDIRKLPFTVRTFREWEDAERWLEPAPMSEPRAR